MLQRLLKFDGQCGEDIVGAVNDRPYTIHGKGCDNLQIKDLRTWKIPRLATGDSSTENQH